MVFSQFEYQKKQTKKNQKPVSCREGYFTVFIIQTTFQVPSEEQKKKETNKQINKKSTFDLYVYWLYFTSTRKAKKNIIILESCKAHCQKHYFNPLNNKELFLWIKEKNKTP